MRHKAALIGLALGLLFIMYSCSNRLSLIPVSSISSISFWNTPSQFDAFVAGIHIAFRAETYNFQALGEMRSHVFGTDEGSSSAFTSEATEGMENLWNNTLDMDNFGVGNFGNFYFNINQINLLISQLNATEILPGEDKSYYLGIAHGMRAFYYFQMYKSWGKVIIKTDPTSSIDVSDLAKPASSEDSVMALIKSDIDLSINSFGNNYSFKNAKSYWSKSATLMLKAQVYLWTSYRGGGTADATTALNALTDIQNNVSSLKLLPDYAKVFASDNKGNDEIIFAIRNRLNESTLPFSRFYPQTNFIANYYDSVQGRKFDVSTDNWGGILRAPIRIVTFRSFDDLDSRKWASITPAYNLVNGKYVMAGCFVSKYKGEQNAGTRVYTNDYPIYRYSELLLLKAEAKVLLGENPANEINNVRARAYQTNYNSAVHGYPNQVVDNDPQEAILQERLFEFTFEGKRWYDLRRMGDQYVYQHTTIKPAESYKLLWPIDRNTLTNNPALEQNPGYPKF